MPKKIAQKCSEGNTKNPLSNNEAPSGKFRQWCFTAWTLESDPPTFFADECKYLLYESEICPDTKRHHWQCYVVWKWQKSFNAMKKLYGSQVHFERCKGSPEANIRYCKKDGKWKDWGKAPAQGERSDLTCVKTDILSGTITCRDIIQDNPEFYHQYGRTLEKLEEIAMDKVWRTEMTKGIWYWGGTGVGKSHKAYKNYNAETHYNLPDDNGWWDGYRQQETVIINDFRGHIPYDRLLRLVDKWPESVNRRGKTPLPFISKTVIITSSLPPDEIYRNRNEKDSLEQLYRRFDIIEIK